MLAPESGLLHEWLRHAAAARPSEIAMVEDERRMTFAELLAQAERLARWFIEHGVQPGDRIVLVLPKNCEAVVSVFASLIAGAIPTPLHPRWPKERILAAVKECDARLLVEVENDLLRIADPHGGGEIDWPAGTEPPLDALPVAPIRWPVVDIEDIALMLFTSGSTGLPKGVALSHRAVGTFVRWTAKAFHLSTEDRLACPSPLGFDLSTFDIFNMALCGASMYLVSDAIAWMPRFLVRFMQEARITCWYSVPSILAGMVADGRMLPGKFPDLRLVLFAGEVFPAPALVKMLAVAPEAELVNLYGPTETNVVTWKRVPRSFDGSEPLPIGTPCPYAKVSIDAESGELLAGGDSLMSAYWNRPEETARRLTTLNDVLYYHTGDRSERTAEGEYLYLGRLDRQVKRRGFRIELDEIEAELVSHPDILEAAVVAIEDSPATVQIAAFIRAAREGLTSAEVKIFGARRLPSYMLPDRICFVGQIAKNNRGKTDYLALRRIAEGWKSGN